MERFDADHRRLLEAITSDAFTVRHQMTTHIYMRKGAIAAHQLP